MTLLVIPLFYLSNSDLTADFQNSFWRNAIKLADCRNRCAIIDGYAAQCITRLYGMPSHCRPLSLFPLFPLSASSPSPPKPIPSLLPNSSPFYHIIIIVITYL